jgi:drug/metabolite transporter (DMT)-like permease
MTTDTGGSSTRSITRLAGMAWFVALLGWSASNLFVRASHTNAEVFTTWRLWLAVIPLAILRRVRQRRGDQVAFWAPGVSRIRWSLFVGGASALFVAGMVTGFSAIDDTNLLDVTLIGSLQPILIVGFAVGFLGEKAEWSLVVRGIVAVAGTVLVALSSPAGSGKLVGNLLAAASMAFSAGWFLYGRVLRDRFNVDPVTLMLCVFTSSAVLMTPVAYFGTGSLRISEAGFGFAAATMATGTTAHLLVVWAHRYLPTSVSAPLLLAEPPIVGLAAWACFDQNPAALAIVGSAVVLAALWGVVRSSAVEHVEEQTPDPVPPT